MNLPASSSCWRRPSPRASSSPCPAENKKLVRDASRWQRRSPVLAHGAWRCSSAFPDAGCRIEIANADTDGRPCLQARPDRSLGPVPGFAVQARCRRRGRRHGAAHRLHHLRRCTIVSFTIETRVKDYYICLLALVTGVFGVFVSLDLFFYYFFYELAVIPMFLLIGIWGSTTKHRGPAVRHDEARVGPVGRRGAGAGGTVGAVCPRRHLRHGRSWSRRSFPKDLQMLVVPGGLHRVCKPHPHVAPSTPGAPRDTPRRPPPSPCCTRACLMKLGAFGVLRIAMGFMPDAAAVLPALGGSCSVASTSSMAVWWRFLTRI